MGVDVRRYIDILIIMITFSYSTCISSFFSSNVLSLLLCSLLKIQVPPADDVKVNNPTYITITENFTFT